MVDFSCVLTMLFKSMLIGTPTVAFLDESINALRILQTPAFSGTAVALAAPIKESATEIEAASITIQAIPVKQNKIPRPPNAFILYRQNHHPKVKESNPALTNNEICKSRYLYFIEAL